MRTELAENSPAESMMSKTILFGAPQVIYLISPQPWKGFHVSKHHYAMELAGLGHRVYFIDPPDLTKERGEISIQPSDYSGLLIVRYAPWFPYKTKFHFRWVFDRFMRRQAKRLVEGIGTEPDIVWDFDNTYQFADLDTFKADINIFHPVDDFSPRVAADKNANLVLSVDQRFLDKIPGSAQKLIIPHGLGRKHEQHARTMLSEMIEPSRISNRFRIGYVGNLEHIGIDWPTILATIDANPAAVFEFIGPFAEDSGYVRQLRARTNCFLRGFMMSDEILTRACDIDVWLVCYDPQLTINGATNSHKILEYLATGNAVLSNRIAAYQDVDLVTMPARSNHEIPSLLRGMLEDFQNTNTSQARVARIQFALKHAYTIHLLSIDDSLKGVFPTTERQLRAARSACRAAE